MAIELLFVGGHFDGRKMSGMVGAKPSEIIELTEENGTKKHIYKLFTQLGFNPEVRIYLVSYFFQTEPKYLSAHVMLRLAKGYNPKRSNRWRKAKIYGAEQEKGKEMEANECG